MLAFLHFLIPVAAILPACQGNIKAHTSRLLTDLLQGYDNRVKPNGINNETLKLVFDAGLYQIIDVDEKNQVLDGIYWMFQQWYDMELTWDPADYGGVAIVYFTDDSIWHPEIALQNEVDVEKSIKGSRTSRLAALSNGLVQRSRTVNYRSSCSMNLRHFPFDTQNCTLSFTSYRHIYNELNLSTSLPFDPESFIENSEFELKDIEIVATYEKIGYNLQIITINHHIILERRPLFFLLNMLLPSILIALVAMLSFCIPPESGEKIGLGITVLLSLSVFLLIVNEQMSPTTKAPLIVIYYFGAVTIVTVSTGLSVLSQNLHQMASDKARSVPTWLRFLCFGKLPLLLCIRSDLEINMEAAKVHPHGVPSNSAAHLHRTRRHSKVGPTEDDRTSTMQLEPSPIEQTILLRMTSCLAVIEAFIVDYEESKRQDKLGKIMQREWKMVAQILDRLLLIAFTALSFLFTLGILLHVSFSSNI